MGIRILAFHPHLPVYRLFESFRRALAVVRLADLAPHAHLRLGIDLKTGHLPRLRLVADFETFWSQGRRRARRPDVAVGLAFAQFQRLRLTVVLEGCVVGLVVLLVLDLLKRGTDLFVCLEPTLDDARQLL